jgi:chromate reductase, NAD(P)H dehydrogenase (quinone)
MHTVLGLAGSLRAGSYNAALLRAAAEVAPSDLALEIGSIRGIPLYDGDVEKANGIPVEVVRLKESVVRCEALLLVTPEYNNSIPGVFKNAIDWLSRPPADIARVFGNRPVALMGASPGYFGTKLAQTAWLPVLRTLGARVYFGESLHVSRAAQAFDTSGKLLDDDVRGRLTRFMAGFAASLG